MAIVLFASAGRLDWPAAWTYVAGWFVAFVVMTLIGVWNPDLMNERGRRAANVKGWDRVLMAIYGPMPFVIMAVAGLDAGRLRWSHVPLALQIAGFAGLALALILPAWAMSANAYLSTSVRIQDDRGHQVVTTGPYRHVRHPLYVGTILAWLCTPLALGSWWALIPATVTAALFVVRTALEDRILRQELPGYEEYTQKVRYRLLPGIW